MIHRKRFTVLCLCATLLMTQAVPAFADSKPPVDTNELLAADAKISKEQAVELAMKFINVPEGFKMTGASYSDSDYPGYMTSSWRISFSKVDKDRTISEISVTVDTQKGKVVDYYRYDYDQQRTASYPPKVNLQQARAIAEQFLSSKEPAQFKLLQYDETVEKRFKPPLQGRYSYPIRFIRVENGIPFPQNYVDFQIDGNGTIMNYHSEWQEEMKFEDVSKVISLEKAKETMLQGSPVLTYRIPWDKREKQMQVYTAYDWPIPEIHAVTGKPLHEIPESLSTDPLTDKPLAPLVHNSKPLTKEQAISKVTDLVTIPQEAVINDANYYEHENPTTGELSAYWNFSWAVKGNDNYRIWAGVNSTTGVVTSIERHMFNPVPSNQEAGTGNVSQETKSKTMEQLQLAADNFVKKALPHLTHQLVKVEMDEKSAERFANEKEAYFIYNRVIDGVKIYDESVRVHLNKQTGDVTSYYSSINNVKYPEKKPAVIGEDKAKQLLISLYDIKMEYAWIPEEGDVYSDRIKLMIASGEINPSGLGDNKAVNWTAKPVYRIVSKYPDTNVFLDAEQGVWRKWNDGSEVAKLEKPVATDVAGHWAEQELQIMMSYDALDIVDGKVNPDQAVTRGEMIKMLIIAMNGGQPVYAYDMDRSASFADVKLTSAYFAYVERAVDLNLIGKEDKQFRPEDHITREELAELIVKALGYGKLAKVKGLFKLDAADAAQVDYVGEVALVTSLGIMTLDNKARFHPDKEVTKAQAAVSFYRYLQKRGELVDYDKI